MSASGSATIRNYIDLTKPRLLPLVLFSGLPVMGMTASGWPPLPLVVAILVGIILGYLGPYLFVMDGFAHFRLHLLLLCAPVAFLALILRKFSTFWRTLVAAVLAVAGLGVLWETPQHEGGSVGISVMTANLYQRNDRPEEMKRAILKADADVLVTMETTKAVLSGEGSLALRYPYRLSLNTSGQTLRTVIWSKFPMRNGTLLLEDLVEPTGAYAVIEVSPDVQFSLLGLHLAHNVMGNQLQQIEALDRIAEALPHPRVVLGDFNATAWSYALKHAETLTSTKRVRGFRVTWQGTYPTIVGRISAPIGLQIDHVLLSEGIGVKAVETLEIPGSDHLAVKVGITLPEG